MRKVLITGGLGFIGSHLVQKLLKNNIYCVVVDNKTTNVVHQDYFYRYSFFEFYQSDVIDFDYQQITGLDCIFHLACVVGPYGVLKHAGRMGANIVNDTVKLVDYCVKHDCKLIDISTSQVYGQYGILDQTTPKIFPGVVSVRNQYALGKLTAQSIIQNTAKIKKNLRYHIIRPFNVTGIRQKPDEGFVLPRFAIAGLTGQPLTVFNDGSMKRSFTSVNDIIEAIFLLYLDQKTVNQIWNIGTLQNICSILDLANQTLSYIQTLQYTDSQIKFVDPKELYGKYFQQVPDKMPNSNKFKNHYTFEFGTPRMEIVKQVVGFYKKKIEEQGYYFDIINFKKFE